MSTGINIMKNASNIFRNRFAYMQQFPNVYNPSVSRKIENLMEAFKEKAETVAKSEIGRKIRVVKGFYTVEMAPPGPGEFKKLISDLSLIKEFMMMGCHKYLTVKQAWLLFLVALEVSMWFFIGETIGKMHLVGYKV